MTQPGLTLSEILLRLSNALGVADTDDDGNETLPTDSALLARLKRNVQDGISRMRLDYNNWYCLRQMVEIDVDTAVGVSNIDSSLTRLALPWFVIGTFSSAWNWKSTTSGDGRSGRVVVTDALTVESRNSLGSGGSGHPEVVAIVPGKEDGTWELKLAPEPDGPYTLTSECSLLAMVPTQLYQRSPFGAVHDQTVIAAAKFMFVEDDAVDVRRDRFKASYDELLARSAAFDLKAGVPKSFGVSRDPGAEQGSMDSTNRQTVQYVSQAGVDLSS